MAAGRDPAFDVVGRVGPHGRWNGRQAPILLWQAVRTLGGALAGCGTNSSIKVYMADAMGLLYAMLSAD